MNWFGHFKVSCHYLDFLNSYILKTSCLLIISDLYSRNLDQSWKVLSSCYNKSKGWTQIFKTFKSTQNATDLIKIDRILIRVFFSTYKTLFGSIRIFCNYATSGPEAVGGHRGSKRRSKTQLFGTQNHRSKQGLHTDCFLLQAGHD